MPETPYSIVEVRPEWVLEPEQLGSKRKFWYRSPEAAAPWLFKHPQANTGQHWAEKIAAEVAGCLGILHAPVELAVFQGERGSTTESFARDGRELFHGNQLLAGRVLGYDPEVKFRNSDHTLSNIWLALERAFAGAEAVRRAKLGLAEYLVLDALIGNTDRHHENWGLLRERVGDDWRGMLAPSFDHASSLGRELLDVGRGKNRARYIAKKRVPDYVENGRGGIFWSSEDPKAVSPLELIRRAVREHPDCFIPAIGKTANVDPPMLESVIAKVPEDWMTPTARQFALDMMWYNLRELRKLLE